MGVFSEDMMVGWLGFRISWPKQESLWRGVSRCYQLSSVDRFRSHFISDQISPVPKTRFPLKRSFPSRTMSDQHQQKNSFSSDAARRKTVETNPDCLDQSIVHGERKDLSWTEILDLSCVRRNQPRDLMPESRHAASIKRKTVSRKSGGPMTTQPDVPAKHHGCIFRRT